MYHPFGPLPVPDFTPPMRHIMAGFVPDAMDFTSLEESPRSKATGSSIDVLAETKREGISIIKDPGPNSRLLAALGHHLPAHIRASKHITGLMSWKQALDEMDDESKDAVPVFIEQDLSDRMTETFWVYANLVLKSKVLNKNLRGVWQSCKSKKGGAASWGFVRKADARFRHSPRPPYPASPEATPILREEYNDFWRRRQSREK
ncbi:hypothetical protein L202_08060 [Cryptococcus amylolentus CBS 6039]|uniref:Uncharacterized protein n=2 Tax=Cryptococcus amylolentus TaxID=104669 RepID=A0A1E3HB42_9TREE|nr:hypothetical protein L202_08060 [Cryptococcus amylolentus CBS 6039]ODN73560.1 hypothetical protein L202_08060 [Cryptococcus amylolentus CBS 6039]ODN99296.1 hypothetical protein I350_07462 [Cryptococcus amylolentus CBS 6273]